SNTSCVYWHLLPISRTGEMLSSTPTLSKRWTSQQRRFRSAFRIMCKTRVTFVECIHLCREFSAMFLALPDGLGYEDFIPPAYYIRKVSVTLFLWVAPHFSVRFRPVFG